MQLSSFPAFGIKGLLAAETPPYWALCILEDTICMLRKTGSPEAVAKIEKEINRIEDQLASRCAR